MRRTTVLLTKRTVIHEALHLVGQAEYPAAPEAPDSLGITRMVMTG